MPAIKISKVSKSNVAYDEHLDWLNERLNTWIPVLDVSFNDEGQILTMAIRRDDSCITLFMYYKEMEYELQGIVLGTPCEYVMTCKICGKERKVEMTEVDYKILQDNAATQGLYVCPDCWEDLT